MSPRKINILILDDESEIRAEINEFLSSRDILVKEASKPSEAFRILAAQPVDIAILDIRLPEMSGIDVLRNIRRQYPEVQAIMMSGHGDMDSVIHALRLGAVDYFQKPFKLNEFIEKVEARFKSHPPATATDTEDLSQQAERVLQQSVDVYKRGDIDRAIELLRGGISIDPLAYKLHYNLGLLLGKKSLVYQAIRELESTLELAPDYFPALKNLALLYQKAGFKFKAIETWERALHHCPEDETRDNIKRHLMEML